MKVQCIKCKSKITKDLFPTKTWEEDHVIEFGVNEFRRFKIKKGTFIIDKLDLFSKGGFLVIREDLINIDMEKFKEGLGCCDVSFGPIYCKNCKSRIGVQNMDCFQDKHCLLFSEKTERSYG